MATAERIENPNEPRHFALLRPAPRLVEVLRAGRVLARTRAALRLLEHGRELYDPVLYLPAADLEAELAERPETTHCPLKGDALYFDLLSPAGGVEAGKIAWSYPQPLGFASTLAGRVAFYADKVTIREGDA